MRVFTICCDVVICIGYAMVAMSATNKSNKRACLAVSVLFGIAGVCNILALIRGE